MPITQQAKNNKQTKQNAYTYKGNKAVIFSSQLSKSQILIPSGMYTNQ